MKNLKDMQLPIFIELDCYNLKEVDDIASGVKLLAESFNIEDTLELQSIHHHPYYDSAAVIVFSILVNTGGNSGVIDFLKNVFENYYQNYPRFAEPIS